MSQPIWITSGLVCWLLLGSAVFAQERTEAEKKVIAAIEKLGGKITVDEKQSGKPRHRRGTQWLQGYRCGPEEPQET